MNKKSVEFSLEEWKSILALLEIGIQQIGYEAFEGGGRVMREIQDQITNPQKTPESQQEYSEEKTSDEIKG